MGNFCGVGVWLCSRTQSGHRGGMQSVLVLPVDRDFSPAKQDRFNSGGKGGAERRDAPAVLIGPRDLAQERSLKMPLVRGECAEVRRKDLLEVFERLPKRIALQAGGRGVFAADQTPPRTLPVPTPADQAVNRLQGKRQAEEFCGGLDGFTGKQFAQQRPQERGIEGMARQDPGEKQREGFPAATTPAAIRTKRPLAPDDLTGDQGRIVTVQDAVTVQGAPLPAVRTAPLLERKSAALNASSSCMNSTGVKGIVSLPARRPTPEARLFPTALPNHGTRLNRGGEIRRGRHSPHTPSVNSLTGMISPRLKHGTSYDGTPGGNS